MMQNDSFCKLVKDIEKECNRLNIENVKIYETGPTSHLADIILIATAPHILQMDAARRQLSQIIKRYGLKIYAPIEDYSEGWLVLDASPLLVHILVPDKREYYDLDGLFKSFICSRLAKKEETACF